MSTLTSNGYQVETVQDLHGVVPAAFTQSYNPARTDRYSHLPTNQLIDTLVELGWNPRFAQQNGTSKWARHFIKFSHKDLERVKIAGDIVTPHAILDNSHDGTTLGAVHLGLFRLICSNGMVIAIPGLASSFAFKHIGLDRDEIQKLMVDVDTNLKKGILRVNTMTNISLKPNEQEEFVIKAIAAREPHRFVGADDEILAAEIKRMNDIQGILTPTREEDKGDELWKVFNRVQEKLVKGGYSRTAPSGRNASARGITNAARNVAFNKLLWNVAEDYIPADAKAPALRNDKGHFIKMN